MIEQSIIVSDKLYGVLWKCMYETLVYNCCLYGASNVFNHIKEKYFIREMLSTLT